MSILPVFDLRIVFTGICSLVTDKPLDGSPERLGLILLDAWHTGRKTEKDAVDKKAKLERHGAMVHFPLRNVSTNATSISRAPKNGPGIWYPRRHQLVFDFVEVGRDNGFKVDRPTVVDHVADMRKIAPGFSRVASDLLSSTPPKQVLANAVFSRGELSTSRVSVRDWEFNGNLAGSAVGFGGMAFKIVLTLRDLVRVVLAMKPFRRRELPRAGNPGFEAEENLELIGIVSGETIEVTISNLCDENPLIWPLGEEPPPDEDLDFKWHYEVLSDVEKNQIFEKLDHGRLDVPFPKLVPTGPLGQGRNCFPAFWGI